MPKKRKTNSNKITSFRFLSFLSYVRPDFRFQLIVELGDYYKKLKLVYNDHLRDLTSLPKEATF